MIKRNIVSVIVCMLFFGVVFLSNIVAEKNTIEILHTSLNEDNYSFYNHFEDESELDEWTIDTSDANWIKSIEDSNLIVSGITSIGSDLDWERVLLNRTVDVFYDEDFLVEFNISWDSEGPKEPERAQQRLSIHLKDENDLTLAHMGYYDKYSNGPGRLYSDIKGSEEWLASVEFKGMANLSMERTDDNIIVYLEGIEQTSKDNCYSEIKNVVIQFGWFETEPYGPYSSFFGNENLDLVSFESTLSPYNNPPDEPTIDGPETIPDNGQGKFIFCANDQDNNPVKFEIDWGDGKTKITDFVLSGETLTLYHRYWEKGDIIVKARAIDTYGALSDWSQLELQVPKNRQISYNFNHFKLLFEYFPHLLELLQKII